MVVPPVVSVYGFILPEAAELVIEPLVELAAHSFKMTVARIKNLGGGSNTSAARTLAWKCFRTEILQTQLSFSDITKICF